MEEGVNRREFLKRSGAAAALTLLPKGVEAQERPFEYFASDLRPEELEAQKEAAAQSLVQDFPAIPEIEYLRKYFPHLTEESQMYIPSREELEYVLSESTSQLDELAAAMTTGSSAVFVFADYNRESGKRQRLYTMRKDAHDKMVFVKAYPISLGREGFGNASGSEKTPLGLHTIAASHMGYFGEVVSDPNQYRDVFNRVEIAGNPHWFVKGLGKEDEVAEIVTDEYHLVGPQTSAGRGIFLHGTNRSGEIGSDGEWKSLLGEGRAGSLGCVRVSNTGIRDLGLSSLITIGSFVMIHATPAAQEAPVSQYYPVPRWNEDQ
ncbi:hypothetical protein COU18_03750 [Candidatus Kaiserbacteria bacterium CG10_big_fil_rev_8_21_14_0_10_51_14]|uniref:L,D-TPase catalytic domain-containing protein n=1 Tax=Candidatus Kaiserbacteria bacterium CG10_big_fil_rev_8_21_14_0_10_51_14 TaxID=1974610 RepID=A0A2H0UBH2_9BACT|nr:MAG: hypothetical protein COU18_03750 [Candidatus Kaiserbacteria bacterium CG10_big_fil_rev_8_21_14_0_10_51_14]